MTLYRTPDGGAYLAFTRCADCGKAIGLLPGHDGSAHPDSGAGWAHVQRPDHPHLAGVPEFVGHRYQQTTPEPDSSPPTPINITDAVNLMTADVRDYLRTLLDSLGISYTEWPAKTCRAALHRVGAGDPPGGVPCSLPLGHDGKHVTESGRAWADPTDQQIRYVVDVVADVRANGGSVEIDGVTISRTGEKR
ncbi:hypothetical protein SEA_FIREBALL_79 [Gordonia phage Fireball]|uniref:Uncharacterized protein n=1 Tax=Gordonia phage Fireball TaxID=2652412 RepID=A0A5P8DA85_9CAUD|nr:hypothetical protein KNU74_gp79 [Gordonia phage Fireball]QFP95904.1 hypothetical protein SEA_FIREBALL_79 [Gordonia phage Fireball]